MNKLKIGICGWGNVATGLYKTILDNQKEIESNSNIKLEIVVIGARRDNPKCDPQNTVIERDIFDVLNHEIDVLVELIGGVEVARELILKSIEKGINVVTANKAVLYHHGDEIFSLADKKNVHVLYESSVCAGTPIIKMLHEELAANKISKISGMLNGTSNFILSEMEDGADFEDTLKFAQKEGYAEADPSFDVEGYDAAHKIGILSSLAFGTSLPPDDFYIEGIEDIEANDFIYAAEEGFSIKHFAVSSLSQESIELRAHPVLISNSKYLANLTGVRNGIEIETDLIGKLHVAGSGAGQASTASGVISDLIYISNVKDKVSSENKHKSSKKILKIDDLKFENYIHIKTSISEDNIALIEQVFDNYKIFIKKIKWKELSKNKNAVIIFTDLHSEKDLNKCISEIEKLDKIVSVKSIRIES